MHENREIPKPARSLKRTLVIFFGNVIGLYILCFLGLGVKVEYFDDILFFVIFISLINALLWPILTKIFMPFLVFTFG